MTTLDGNPLSTTVTSTTVRTPTSPTALPSADNSAAWPKFIPDKVPKETASSSSSSDSTGLTQAQLGGIIGGVVGLLVIVLAATFIIIRRLRKTAHVVEQSRNSASSATKPGRNKQMSQYHRPTPSQIDRMEYDDLLQLPGGPGQSTSASEFSSVNPTPFPSSGDEARQTSLDTSRGYFDVPQRVQNRPGRHSTSTGVRTSVDSHNTVPQTVYQHARNMSNASELSDGSAAPGVGSPLLPAELGIEGGLFPELPATPVGPDAAGRRRSSSGVSPLSPGPMRPPMSHTRRMSDGHSRERSGSSATQGQHLDVVAESVEHMHGYYGPPSFAAGQTRAGVDVEYDISSPVAMRERGPPGNGPR
jgi:hypothetical protein